MARPTFNSSPRCFGRPARLVPHPCPRLLISGLSLFAITYFRRRDARAREAKREYFNFPREGEKDGALMGASPRAAATSPLRQRPTAERPLYMKARLSSPQTCCPTRLRLQPAPSQFATTPSGKPPPAAGG